MNKKDLGKVKIGVSPLTDNVYLYVEGVEGKGFVDVDYSSDITNEFISICSIMLQNTKEEEGKSVIRFSVKGKEREFWLSEIRPNY